VIVAKTDRAAPEAAGHDLHGSRRQIEKAGGKALAIPVDIREDAAVYAAVAKAVETFGGIDILVNNASAISLTGTLETPMKRYDLMHHINTRGTFLCSQACIPHLKKAANPHILNLSPPLSMKPQWFGGHVAYTMAKYGMSMCVLGMAEEFKGAGIAVNALWPRTAIATAAVQNLLGGDAAMKGSRTVEIMSDAAYVIFNRSSKDAKNTGNFFIDDDVLKSEGVTDFTKYAVDPTADLVPDFFVD
jgi:citronellol/citronellal dehydrogenase